MLGFDRKCVEKLNLYKFRSTHERYVQCEAEQGNVWVIGIELLASAKATTITALF